MVILLNIEYVRILKKLDRKGKHNSQITSLTLPNLSTMTMKAPVTLKITTVYEFFNNTAFNTYSFAFYRS